MKFKSEYMLRLEHTILSGANWDQPKPQLSGNTGMFTPMSPDDYHLNGRLVQERESFQEQRERVARMTKI
jgi:hypothetical protein